MINILSKYFSAELTAEEVELFLSKVNADEDLRKEFIEMQQLTVLTNLLSREGDEERARLSLFRFMAMKGKKNEIT